MAKRLLEGQYESRGFHRVLHARKVESDGAYLALRGFVMTVFNQKDQFPLIGHQILL